MPVVIRPPLSGIIGPEIAGDSLPASDDFNRANTTSGAGNCSDGVHTWVDLIGTSGIISNRFYIPTLSGLPDGLSVIDIGTVVATHQVTLPTALSAVTIGGIAFRVIDASNYMFCYYNWQLSRLRLYKRETGTFNEFGSGEVAVVLNDGDVMKVIDDGTNIDYQINNVSKITASTSLFNTATKCGIEAEVTTSRFDSYSVT